MELSENDIRPRLTRCKSDFVSVACPACGAHSCVPEFEKYDFSFDRCTECGTVYMNPRATEDILADFYAGSVLYQYWDEYIFPASRGARRERIFRPRVRRILDLCEELHLNPGLLVEVGSASGMFCEEALATGEFGKVLGIEPNAAQAQTCRRIGVEVIESTIERAIDLDEQADVVVSFETIEHVYSPRRFLDCCHRLLAPGGLLILTCPNYEGFDIMTLGPVSDSLYAEHINMFNPRSLAHVLQVSNSMLSWCARKC